ncbi:MAG: 4Fe-4S dicluster domain-containing protein [bacterium]|nr:4Fe-4S dicluster domain-containing protein [bacterium]
MAYSITKDCTGCTVCTTVCPVDAISGKKKSLHTINKGTCVHCGACGKICNFDAVLDPSGTLAVQIKRSQWTKPVVHLKDCYSCENCVAVCPVSILEMRVPEQAERNKKNMMSEYAVLTNAKKCISCGWCSEICGFDAITMEVPEKPAAEAK